MKKGFNKKERKELHKLFQLISNEFGRVWVMIPDTKGGSHYASFRPKEKKK